MLALQSVSSGRLARQRQNPDAHGPGPPQRPHMPGGAADDDLDLAPTPSAPTAKRLIARAVFVEPHDGHFTFAAVASSAPLIVRCNCSNFSLHALQVYS
jgi:hypothetical protein